MSEPRLSIAVVIEYVSPRGGQDRVALELARRWARRHEVTLYCYDADEELLAGARVRRLKPHPRNKLLGATLLPFLSSAALVGRRHDIVIAHGGNCFVPNFALFHTCHPLRLETYKLVAEERGRPLTPQERVNMLVRRRLFIPMERRTVRRCRGRAFAVSRRLKEDLIRFHGVGDEDVLVAVNGVDTRVFNPGVKRFRGQVRREAGIGEAELTALFVGGIWWEKGLHVAIRALAQTRWPWRLMVVGSDSDEPVFRQMAAELGVAERVHFLGRTTQPERFYGAADCLVLPSRFEGFPLVSLEAAACGLPVLISREGHPGELIDERTGYVLDREPNAFARALDELAADEGKRRAMGEAAAAEASKYTWDQQAETLEQAFIEYAAARRAR